MLNKEDGKVIPAYVLTAYLLNPYIVCNCVAMSTSVFSNLVVALILWSMARKAQVVSSCLIALACHQTFYPVMLLVPLILATEKTKLLKSALKTITVFTISLIGLLYLSYTISGTWRFLDSSYGCM